MSRYCEVRIKCPSERDVYQKSIRGPIDVNPDHMVIIWSDSTMLYILYKYNITDNYWYLNVKNFKNK